MLRTITLAGLLLIAPLAWSADNGIYIGAGVVKSDYGFSNPGSAEPFDDEASSYKLIAGWRPLDKFGVEVTYIDFGDATVPAGIICTQFITTPCPSASSLAAETLSAFAVGYINLPLVDLFAKAGVNSWQMDGHTTGGFTPAFRFNESGTDFAYGAGVQVRFGSLGARLEYERFEFVKDETLDSISLSFTYTFL